MQRVHTKDTLSEPVASAIKSLKNKQRYFVEENITNPIVCGHASHRIKEFD